MPTDMTHSGQSMSDPSRTSAKGDDARAFSAAAARNRTPIFTALQPHLPDAGVVLEIASGSGEHAVAFAAQLGHLTWQPSDFEDEALASIEAWRRHAAVENIRPPLRIDITEPEAVVLPDDIQLIFNANMIHISPWACCRGLMALAGRALPPGGILFLYGPFRREGRHTAPSNADFDGWLKSQDPAWGVRDLEDVIPCAAAEGLGLVEVLDMPANNFAVIFCQSDA